MFALVEVVLTELTRERAVLARSLFIVTKSWPIDSRLTTCRGAAPIEAAKGRRLLFVDTCHSGNAYNQRLGNAAYHANIIAYTAARFDQEAVEDARLGHGIFTYALVEGLESKGNLAPKQQISTKGLADYIIRRVGALAKELKAEQEPQYFKGRDAEDFVLVR